MMLYSIELWVGVSIGALSAIAVFLTVYLWVVWYDARQSSRGIEFLQDHALELKGEGIGRVKRTDRH